MAWTAPMEFRFHGACRALNAKRIVPTAACRRPEPPTYLPATGRSGAGSGEVAMADDAIARRGFLLGVGLAGTAAATGVAAPQRQDQAGSPDATPSASNTEPEPLLTLTAAEHAFIVAAVDTIIPADELSPSGSDCGVATFIDRQLASAVAGRFGRE